MDTFIRHNPRLLVAVLVVLGWYAGSALMAEAAPNYTSCTKYVSPSGSVNGNTAYTTLQAGVNALVPGDTLCVGAGTYHESVAVKRSGTVSSPITIRALDSANKPTIDGQYSIPGGRAVGGGSSYCQEYSVNPNANLGPYPRNACKADSTMQGANLVTIEASNVVWDGINVTRSRGAGVILGNATGGGWYVTPLDNPSQATWYYNIKFLNSSITHVRSMGAFILYADGVTFSGNTIKDSNNFASYNRWAGVNAGESGYGWLAWSHDLSVVGKNIVISDNTFAQSFGEGIQLSNFVFHSNRPEVFRGAENVVIRNNVFYDHWSADLYVGVVDNLKVEGNVIYSSGDPTFFPDWHGYVAPSSCVSVGSELGHPGAKNVVFANNIVSGCGNLVSLGMDLDSSYANISFYNNTLLNPYGRDGAVLANQMRRLSGFTFINNIAHAPQGSIFSGWYGFNTASNMNVRNNVWSSAPTPRSSLGSGSTFPQANLSGSGDIVTTTPGLTNPTYRPTPRGSFDTTSVKLVSGSPAINAGTNVAGVVGDYFGGARPNGSAFDIGAHEFGSTPGTVSPAPTPGTPTTPSTCQNTLTSSTAIPAGYGASYNPLTSAREYLVQAACTTASTATITAGNGNPLTYVYNRGYYYSGTTWTPYTLTCASGALISGAWCPGRATASIPLPQNPTNVIAYTCQYTNNTWKCGCRDSTCSTAYWQLQRVGR